MWKKLKITETLGDRYSSDSTEEELSNEYQHGRVCMAFRQFSVLLSCIKEAAAFKGLNLILQLGRGPCVELKLRSECPLVIALAYRRPRPTKGHSSLMQLYINSRPHA